MQCLSFLLCNIDGKKAETLVISVHQCRNYQYVGVAMSFVRFYELMNWPDRGFTLTKLFNNLWINMGASKASMLKSSEWKTDDVCHLWGTNALYDVHLVMYEYAPYKACCHLPHNSMPYSINLPTTVLSNRQLWEIKPGVFVTFLIFCLKWNLLIPFIEKCKFQLENDVPKFMGKSN